MNDKIKSYLKENMAVVVKYDGYSVTVEIYVEGELITSASSSKYPNIGPP